MDYQIQRGNKTKCTQVGGSTINIHRESGKRNSVIDLLHVPGLGMIMISASALQDKGYDIYFVGKKVYIKCEIFLNAPIGYYFLNKLAVYLFMTNTK